MRKQPLLYTHNSNTNALTGKNLELLLEALDDFVVVLDAEGHIIKVNQASLRMTGYKLDEVIGKPIDAFDARDSRSRLYEEVKQLLHGNEEKAIAHMVGKDGRVLQVEYRTIKVVWDDVKALLILGKDVSDTSSIRKALTDSISQQRALLDNFPFQAWVKSKAGTYLAVNKEFAAGIQRQPHEIIGKTDFDLLPKARAQRYYEMDQQVVRMRERLVTQSEVEQEGHFVWRETFKTPIINEEGEVTGIAGITRDITHEKQFNHKLQRNIRQYQLLTEVAYQYSTPQGFEEATNKVLELVGRHLDVSRVYVFEDHPNGASTTNTFEWVNAGITPQIEELVEVPYEIIPSWRRILLEDGILLSLNIKELPKDLYAILAPQGIISILIYPLYVKGKFHGFIGYDECVKERVWENEEVELLKTITHIISNAIQREKSSKEVLESERKYREFVELLPEMICEADHTGVIHFANKLAIKKLGLSSEQLKKGEVSVFDLFPASEQDRIRNNLQRVIRGDEMTSVDFEYEALNAAGHLFPSLVYVNTIRKEGEFAGIRGVMVDITERKQTEIKLREAKERAEMASLAKQNFLATMSHEIRTPLNAIIGSVHLMKDEQDPAEQRDHIATLEFASQNLLALINDILDFSKIEAGKIDLEVADFNLPILLRKSVGGFQSRAEQQGLQLRLTGLDELPEVMVGDSGRLAQILNNLISNAIKFTKHGIVEVRSRMVGLKGNTHWLEMQVEDTGIGIPADKLDRIWDSFIQLDDFRSRKYEGSGLGLAITRKLIDLMGGEVTVKSEQGKGTTFTVTIPLRISKQAVKPAIDSGRSKIGSLQGHTILLVEDNIVNQRIASRFLKRWDAQVDIAENGAIALERIAQMDYDLVLMDLQMPVMDGYSCAKTIRKLPDATKANIPIIALTASALLEVQREVLGAGMNDFITKPFNPQDLYMKIAKQLS